MKPAKFLLTPIVAYAMSHACGPVPPLDRDAEVVKVVCAYNGRPADPITNPEGGQLCYGLDLDVWHTDTVAHNVNPPTVMVVNVTSAAECGHSGGRTYWVESLDSFYCWGVDY